MQVYTSFSLSSAGLGIQFHFQHDSKRQSTGGWGRSNCKPVICFPLVQKHQAESCLTTLFPVLFTRVAHLKTRPHLWSLWPPPQGVNILVVGRLAGQGHHWGHSRGRRWLFLSAWVPGRLGVEELEPNDRGLWQVQREVQRASCGHQWQHS